jgi:hypothetical protein
MSNISGHKSSTHFNCSFCEETFSTENLFDTHLLEFHRISKKKIDENCPKKQFHESSTQSQPKETKRLHKGRSKKSETLSNIKIERGKSSSPKHQCYICALEFNLKSILSLHLEKVHLIGGGEEKAEQTNETDKSALNGKESSKLTFKAQNEYKGSNLKPGKG